MDNKVFSCHWCTVQTWILLCFLDEIISAVKRMTVSYEMDNFDVHRAVHFNFISIVKPTRCTNVSNLFYFGMTLYMLRMVFPSIIRNSRLYIQQYKFDTLVHPVGFTIEMIWTLYFVVSYWCCETCSSVSQMICQCLRHCSQTAQKQAVL